MLTWTMPIRLSHVLARVLKNNYPSLAAGGSHYASMPGYLKTIIIIIIRVHKKYSGARVKVHSGGCIALLGFP